MKFPSYERQNQWISDYIAPIMIDLDIGKVVQNYKRNRLEALGNEMANAGVFESLERLENEGTSWDKIMFQMKEGIESAKRAKMYKQIDFSTLRGLFSRKREYSKNIYYMPLRQEERLFYGVCSRKKII